jgi:hypothetical protein
MDMMEAWEPTLTDLHSTYNRYYSLACLNVSPEQKFALISLICFLTQQARKKNPSVTVEQVIKKITASTTGNSPGLLRALCCICEDYLKVPGEFPIFGAKSSKEIVDTILKILNMELPFENGYPVNDIPF